MRHDMSRLIVERPRRGGNRCRKGRQVALEDLPSKQGMRRRHVELGVDKDLNENLAPLRRYLERQVGRPWDKVYSEIAACLRVDSTVQQHVRDHLGDYVLVKPRREVGWRFFGVTMPGGWIQRFYVDPADGILKRTDQMLEVKARRAAARRRRLHEEPIDRVPLSSDRELRRLGGIWFEVKLAPLPEPAYRVFRVTETVPLSPWMPTGPSFAAERVVRRLMTPGCFDVVTGEAVLAGPELDNHQAWKDYRERNPDRRYAIAKRQLSRVELRRHGLVNDVAASASSAVLASGAKALPIWLDLLGLSPTRSTR